MNIGNQSCEVKSINNTHITCSLLSLNLGDHLVRLNADGDAINAKNLTVTGKPAVFSMNPTNGSVYGGQIITLTGNGFSGNSVITIGPATCRIISYKVDKATCIIDETSDPYPEYYSYTVKFCFEDNCLIYPDMKFFFISEEIPNIVNISPTEGISGQILNIFGSNFGFNDTGLKVRYKGCPILNS